METVDFAAALARLARFTGFKVEKLIDARSGSPPRSGSPTPTRWRWSPGRRSIWPPAHDDATYAAVLTHEPRFDDPTLTALLRGGRLHRGHGQPPGPRRAAGAAAREPASAMTTSPASPAPSASISGTCVPEETAVSILAKVIAARHGARSGPLSERSATVHSIRERGEL